jgi:hypothetical protein
MANPSPGATPGLVMSGMDAGPSPLALKGAALPESTSFGLVSSEAVPPAVDKLREPDAAPSPQYRRPGHGQGLSRARRARPIRDDGKYQRVPLAREGVARQRRANAGRSIPSAAMSARPGKGSRSYVQRN